MPPRANYTPLSPRSFLTRSARVYPAQAAVIRGEHQTAYLEFSQRACRIANALRGAGLRAGDAIALLAPNTPAHLEWTLGAQGAGVVFAPLNTRLNASEIAYIVRHCRAKALVVDAEYLPLASEVLNSPDRPALLIVIEDEALPTPALPPGAVTYAQFVAEASDRPTDHTLADENGTMALYYTSGTTGGPKGVMFSHRHAYLAALCNLMMSRMTPDSRYLWTLPMFHVSGWCFAWVVTAIGAAHVCLRKPTPDSIVEQILTNRVTHLCGAPIVLQMIAEGAAKAGISRFPRSVLAATAAAPPSPAIIERMLALNVEILHVYGLTETGPGTVCEPQADWAGLSIAERARRMARQGVAGTLSGEVDVMDADTRPVHADGKTMGEVCMRGNSVMRGYLNDEAATAKAFRGGWFHSGDLGVKHSDGYVELMDRAKDIIISGGENISTIEIENVLVTHPAVKDVAVVSRPDERWGEVPVAFVHRNGTPSTDCTEADLIAFCRERLAHFKVPKSIIFEELQRTSTGKIQKFMLRERMWKGFEKRIN